MKSKHGCYYVLFENQITNRFPQCHVFAQSPPGRRHINKYPVYISHRSRFVLLAVIFDSNGNSYTATMESVMCIYAHILHNIHVLVG